MQVRIQDLHCSKSQNQGRLGLGRCICGVCSAWARRVQEHALSMFP